MDGGERSGGELLDVLRRDGSHRAVEHAAEGLDDGVAGARDAGSGNTPAPRSRATLVIDPVDAAGNDQVEAGEVG